ncbi:MAG: hypothetical protein LKE41_10025 [Prevotella sp.]|jgi:RNA polymerase sigma-70 factor (ECF subfamily)|nr:hypothetical protein [Prevotella sp.]MCI2080150.1 hypothetical protein [Prevotella sp.]MCI2102047.1 hypothetical protein [Prevotella sp.]
MNVNDKEIIQAIREHPEQGFRKLMAAYMQPVYWHIRRMVSVHADAEVLALKEDEWFDSSDKLSAKLQCAIHTLPAKQQATFNLRYYDELSYDEIAEVTDSTTAAAKANYHVAKEKIIDYMNHND